VARILLAINPEYVQNILSGIKKYEFRKSVAKQPVSSIIIYETVPTKKVVAEVEVVAVLKASPEELWTLTSDAAGTSKDFFDAYFTGREFAYAYKLGKVNRFDEPKELSEYGLTAAPQGFVYIQ
jgi:predicted transcriptional regulator